MSLTDSQFRILYAISKSITLTTSEIRKEIGKDPHPTLGRLERAGLVLRATSTDSINLFNSWYLTGPGWGRLLTDVNERTHQLDVFGT